MKQLADRASCLAVLPTFGFGNWWHEAGVAATARAVRYAVESGGADAKRVYLVGLSNGGLGVSAAAAELGDRLAGVAFLSAVTDPEAIASEAFAEHWKGRPVYFAHGSADERVSLQHAEFAAGLAEEAGARVTFRTFEGADHFVLAAERERVLQDLAAWITAPPEPVDGPREVIDAEEE